MSHKKDDKRVNVVIIGGGSAGAAVARTLSKSLDSAKHNIILINNRPYSVLLPATLRMVVSDVDDLEEKALVPLDKIFIDGNGTFVLGSAKSIRPDETGKSGTVVLHHGEDIPYDVLVLATGSVWSGPSAFPEDTDDVKEFIKNSRDKYAKAKDIVVVGGGAVGLELVGEIKDIWPSKEVTVVHGDSKLLNATYPDRFRNGMANSVKARGIKLVLGEFVDDIPTSGSFTTRKGTKLSADLVVATPGPRPNTSLVSTFASDALTGQGTVKVSPTLQVTGHPNIFAAGDIIEWKEQKQAFKAGLHAAIVAANVQAYLAGQALKPYKGSTEMIVVTNGKGGGLGYMGFLWGITLGAWFARMVKSKDLIVPRMRAAYGY